MAEKHTDRPRRMRRVVQTLAFVLFAAFLIGIPVHVAAGMRGDWVMRFSPLSGIGASASAWQVVWAFWPAAVLLVAAVVLGRFFCGWLCPLGAGSSTTSWRRA